MSDKPSFWCSSFSRFWWWLLALLGLPLLLFLMNHFQQPQIEADLNTRVSEALAAENINWAEVNVQQRGRDVLLQGEPESDIERERAQQVALGVYGVNTVDFAGAYLPAAGDQAGQDMVQGDNNVAESDPAAQEMADPMAEENENKTVEAVTEKQELPAEESGQTQADEVVQENTEVRLPPELTMTKRGEQLVLDGKMASQQQIDALQNEAARQVGVANVVNNLQIDEGLAEAGWLDLVAKMIGTLPAGSELKVNANQLTLSGEVAEAGDAEQLVTQAEQMLQSTGLQLDNAIQVAVKPAEPDPAQQTTAKAEECQSRLNTAMQDRKIQFTFNDVRITRKSNALLDDLAQIILECSDVMAGRVIVIGGHTDSVGRDAYNLDLSQRRANSVRDYLTGKQIDAALLEAKGFGESQPVASNNTAQGQAQNRRITFEIKQQ